MKFEKGKKRRTVLYGSGRELLIVFVNLAGATLLGSLFWKLDFPETNIVLLYSFAIFLIARFCAHPIYGVLAAIAGTLIYNYFFTEPYFTLNVYDSTCLITFMTMTITSLLTSALVSSDQEHLAQTKRKEAQVRALYLLTNELNQARDEAQILEIGTQMIEQTFHQPARFVYGACSSRGWCVQGPQKEFGMFLFDEKTPAVQPDQEEFVRSICECMAIALDREYNVQEKIRSQEERIQEHDRANLLRSISHDLRTPLSAIMGSSEMLQHEQSGQVRKLADGIYQNARWLYDLVENILILTRINDGRMQIHKQPEAVEEVVGYAVGLFEKNNPNQRVDVRLPKDFVMVDMDAKLITQVLLNLLENARKHTPPGQPIELTVKETDREVRFCVADHGAGIRAQDMEHVFEMFYTQAGQAVDAHRGVGLGLTICESIVKAHGGWIKAENRASGQGAMLTFALKKKGENDHGNEQSQDGAHCRG